MINETTKLKLLKPDKNEFYSIDTQNSNMDIIDVAYTEIEDSIGDKEQLVTTKKDNIVNAVNECFQYANSGKEQIKTAIGEVDDKVQIPQDATFTELAECIKQIESGIDTSDATAKAEQILQGMTAYVNNVKVTGEMPNNPAFTTPVSIAGIDGHAHARIPKGAYLTVSESGYPVIDLADADFTASNIMGGKNIFGLQGSATSDATAVAGNLLAGKTAYVNGVKVTGTMADNSGGDSQALATDKNASGNIYLRPKGGYWDGIRLTYANDPNFVSSNIKKGKSIFGVVGTLEEAGLNVYVQNSAPATPKGIWIKNASTITPSQVVQDNNIWVANSFMPVGAQLPNFFGNQMSYSRAMYKDGYIYHSNTNGARPELSGLYKIHPSNGVATGIVLNTAPLRNSYSWCKHPTKPGYAYMVYNSSSNVQQACELNFTTGAITNLSSTLPESSFWLGGDIVYIDGYIYYMYTSTSKTLYRFNATTGQRDYSWYYSIGEQGMNPRMVAIGSYIYFVSSIYANSTYTATLYRIDPIAKTMTQIAVLGTGIIYHKIETDGNNIYVYGGTDGSTGGTLFRGVLVYNLTTNQSQVYQQPYRMDNSYTTGVFADGVLYIHCSYDKYMVRFSLNSKQFPENTFVITRNDFKSGTYYTELVTPKSLPLSGGFNRLETGFNDAFLYNGGTLKSLPTYFGNGSSWVQYK